MNTAERKPPSLETKIGLFWLHKLGIASLVFGVVFLITYSIQLCGNPFLESLLKLGSGLVVSILLLVVGSKMSGKANQKWFAHGLTAGGWSLAYFTTYAAHYLPDVRVIHSLGVETVLLSLVAAGSLWSALRARSELMAVYSITLASVTILMNGLNLFSDISFLIIAVTASVLGNLQSWRRLFGYALACCYAGHFFCTLSHTLSTGDSIIATTFLSLIWLTFTIGIGMSLSTQEKAKNSLTTLACVNAGLFATGLALFNTPALANFNESIFASAGLLYLAASQWMKWRDEEQMHTVHSLLGLFLINAAKSMHFSGMTLFTVDVLQIGLLAYVGLKYRINTFKWAAVALSALFIPAWFAGLNAHASDVAYGITGFSYVRFGTFTAAVFAALAFIHIRVKDDWYPYFYHLAANGLMILSILQIVDHSWIAFALALLAVANLLAGMIRNSNYYATVGLFPLILSIGFSATNVHHWLSLPMSLFTFTLLGGHMLGRICVTDDGLEPMNRPGWLLSYIKTEKKAEYVEAAHWLLAYFGVISLTSLVFAKVPTDFVSLALGIEGLSLLGAGFLLKEKFFRLSGLVVLAMLTLKLLFVDLAHHDTIERIMSFMVTGVIFLLSSYAYGKFTRSFEDDAEEPVAAEPEFINVLNISEVCNQDLVYDVNGCAVKQQPLSS
ncbi:MAG: DUF2339 domain-containing protein [Candidatus Melainabacteria bacterium]|nr:DUF2339 domain-containing protein [Candidatus Melainabacteria bacterium]